MNRTVAIITKWVFFNYSNLFQIIVNVFSESCQYCRIIMYTRISFQS